MEQSRSELAAVATPNQIGAFYGDYRFLSNFYPSWVEVGGFIYPTAEHAFQAQKTQDLEVRRLVSDAVSPGDAKRVGRTIALRPDWESVKFEAMYEVVRAKFVNNLILGRALAKTAPLLLIEGNTWHDQIWGDCTCQAHRSTPGGNALGITLMFVRLEVMARG